ncbi:dipeptidyl aminopeptidase [Microlunatus endophyticus]|uniref:Dipeptidyl aminopeptidase n=1 Tax=Microlunatus endophyticus TaxID=1716077 RepID=A0A917W170_9ACTN|nr:S9 family peptidase [Microlunatus endophyticus]GGL55042.1 dipeptidyl aminopeptidase [Microlunatus endophyticus]
MQPADLDLINSVSAPSLHPDGSVSVAAVTRPDLGADSYVGQLWTVPVDGAAPRRLTRGYRDTAPQYSPDGGLIGFLRAAPGKPPQVYVVTATGGEPVQVTDRKLGVSQFAWSPDGSRIAFTSRDPEQGRYGTIDGLDAGAEPPRRITTLKYSQNGLGYDIDRRAHVFVVEVPDPAAEPVVQPVPSVDGKPDPVPDVPPATKITSADTDHQLVDFSPDGSSLAVIAAVHPGRDLDRRTDLLLIGVTDAGAGPEEPRNLTGAYGPYAIGSAAFAPDGKIFFVAGDLGPEGLDFIGRSHALYAIDHPTDHATDPDAAPVRVTDPATYDLGGEIVPRTDGSVLVVESRKGTQQLLSVAPTGEVEALTDGSVDISGFDATDTTMVVSYSHPTSFGDIGVVADDGITDLTDFSAAIRERGLVTPTELTITGRDGYPVHGWLAVPDGEGPFPVLLMIHGGPFAAYGVGAFDETQILAGAGYAVAYCNPRGSRSYGEDHGRAIRRSMGTVDLADVLDFLDEAIASDERLDGDRTGILGGSYGGYLTAWTIAHDHRWSGAIVERGFLDPELFAGTSDIGSFFGQEYVGTDPEQIAAQSPQAHVADVTTPTLVLHSEQDLRCPLSQAERYYASLKWQGVETELVVFPGENHELSRAGRPRHRRQRFEIVLDWWSRTLPG